MSLFDSVGGRKWALCITIVAGVFACSYWEVVISDTAAEIIKWTIIAYLPANVIQKKLLEDKK